MRTSSLLLLVALAACSKGPAAAATKTEAPKTDVVSGPLCDSLPCADRNRIQGAETAKVWLIMASDFECPYCKMFHEQIYPSIIKEYVAPGKVQLAYLNHPMPSHRFGQISAEAGMCAALQGRFWQMHDSLFAEQDKWAGMGVTDPMPTFEQLATAIGLQVPAWKSCVQSHKTLPLIDNDNLRTTRSGVRGTPSFILMLKSAPAQGRMAVEGLAPYSEYKRVLDSALAKAGSP